MKALTRESCRKYLEAIIFNYSENTQPGLVGIELEVFPFKKSENSVLPVPFSEYIEILISTSKDLGGTPIYEEEINGIRRLKKIAFPNGDNFQFEPGGQIEIIINPCKNLPELEVRLASKQSLLSEISKAHGIYFTQHGTNPFFDTEELGLQNPKSRYQFLQNYLDEISDYGRKMMRLTGSLQINLDSGKNEETCVKRIVAANLISPFATALFANSSVTSGIKGNMKSFRAYIWQHLDSKRTGILPLKKITESWKKDTVIEEYLNFSLEAPIIYFQKGSSGFPSKFTFGYWIENPIESQIPKLKDFEQHLSLLFPEVRLRKYLELRSVDAPPDDWQMIPVYFYTGLLYNPATLENTQKLLLPYKNDLSIFLKKAINGLEDDELYRISGELMKLAIDGFSDLPSDFINKKQQKKMQSFHKNFTSKRLCPAETSVQYFDENFNLKY